MTFKYKSMNKNYAGYNPYTILTTHAQKVKLGSNSSIFKFVSEW